MSRAKLTVLSRDEMETIHGATLDLLEHVGVVVREPRAMRLLADAGASREGESDRVLIPVGLIEEAVAKVPKTWTWYARESKNNLVVGGGGRTRLGPGSACTSIVDFETGKARAPTVKDADAMVRLMDALEYVDINYTPVSVREDDVPARYQEVATLVRDLRNTSKVPVGPSYDGVMAKDGLEIAKILAGDPEAVRKRPMIAGYCDPISPLVHDRMMTETLMEYAAMGQPVFITSLDLAGASAPATLAGTLLQQNAEILSGLLIAFLVNRDAKLICGSVSGAMDMRAGNAALGGPEFGLLSIASAQMSHFYGLPCSTGGQSDSKIHDAQASLEKATSLLASVLAGADFVDLFFGSYEGFNTTSLEQVVIDHDLAGFAFRYEQGIDVNEETLSLNLLREVGPGGNFLRGKKALEHAMKWSKREHYTPFVIDRRSRFSWESAGGKTLLEEAHERVKKILSSHEPAPLEPSLLKEMDAYLERVKKQTA